MISVLYTCTVYSTFSRTKMYWYEMLLLILPYINWIIFVRKQFGGVRKQEARYRCLCFIFSEWSYTYCSTRISCLVSRPVVCFKWVFSTLFYTSCEMLLYTLMNKEKQKSLIFFLFYSFLKYCGSCIINKYLYTS